MSAGLTARRALAALVAAGALCFAAPARADEPRLPADVEAGQGLAPWRPGPGVRGAEALLAWAERVAALAGEAQSATRRAELLLGAATAIRPLHGAQRRAAQLAVAAHNALPWQDPLAALALLVTVELWLDAGAFEASRGALARLRDWRALPGPVDPDALTLERWHLAQRLARERYPELVARYWESQGKPIAAAAALREAADDPERASGASVAWERIARFELLGKRRAESRAAGERALLAAADAETKARLSFWLLHLDHGLLRPDGMLGPARSAEEAVGLKTPGKAYLAALGELVERLAGSPALGGHLLSAASTAFAARASETALAIYRLALADPFLRRAAWQDGSVQGGLLLAVESALLLGRLDDAEALLDEIASLASGPLVQGDALRVRIRLARERERERAARPPEPAAPPAPRRPERATGTLAVPDAATPDDASRDPGAERETPPPSASSPLLWAALLAAALLSLLWLRRRAHRAG